MVDDGDTLMDDLHEDEVEIHPAIPPLFELAAAAIPAPPNTTSSKKGSDKGKSKSRSRGKGRASTTSTNNNSSIKAAEGPWSSETASAYEQAARDAATYNAALLRRRLGATGKYQWDPVTRTWTSAGFSYLAVPRGPADVHEPPKHVAASLVDSTPADPSSSLIPSSSSSSSSSSLELTTTTTTTTATSTKTTSEPLSSTSSSDPSSSTGPSASSGPSVDISAGNNEVDGDSMDVKPISNASLLSKALNESASMMRKPPKVVSYSGKKRTKSHAPPFGDTEAGFKKSMEDASSGKLPFAKVFRGGLTLPSTVYHAQKGGTSLWPPQRKRSRNDDGEESGGIDATSEWADHQLWSKAEPMPWPKSVFKDDTSTIAALGGTLLPHGGAIPPMGALPTTPAIRGGWGAAAVHRVWSNRDVSEETAAGEKASRATTTLPAVLGPFGGGVTGAGSAGGMDDGRSDLSFQNRSRSGALASDLAAASGWLTGAYARRIRPKKPRTLVCEVCETPSEQFSILWCTLCGRTEHGFCAGLSEIASALAQQDEDWMCSNCKTCVICMKEGDVKKMMMCEDCDRAYHTYCLSPPLKSIPFGKWRCSDCVYCVSCGSRTPGVGPSRSWRQDYLHCEACANMHAKGKFCPLCNHVYRDSDEGVPMAQCEFCEMWVHAACEGLSASDYSALSNGKTLPKRSSHVRAVVKDDAGQRVLAEEGESLDEGELIFCCLKCRAGEDAEQLFGTHPLKAIPPYRGGLPAPDPNYKGNIAGWPSHTSSGLVVPPPVTSRMFTGGAAVLQHRMEEAAEEAAETAAHLEGAGDAERAAKAKADAAAAAAAADQITHDNVRVLVESGADVESAK